MAENLDTATTTANQAAFTEGSHFARDRDTPANVLGGDDTAPTDTASLPPFAAARRRLAEAADARATPSSSTGAALPEPAAPTVDVWEFQAEQRRLADKVSMKNDIGYHRPSMVELQPVLDLHATGTATGGELFDAFEPLRRDSNRPIVGYVRIATGFHTNHIDEGKALKAVLFDNQHQQLVEPLADLIQLRKDSANQQLILGFASFQAIERVMGATFKIPVKEGSKTFKAESSHAMDGFHVDILDFGHDRAAERHLWSILAAWDAPPIAGGYTHVSESHGAKTSRYRLTFTSDSPPSLFQANGRLIDEVIFLGRCYRIYGKGWYNHKKTFQRADLDIAAKERKISIPSASAPATNSQQPRATGESKRQCVAPPPPTPWRRVERGASAAANAQPRPWVSDNMFDILRQHVVVTAMQITNSAGDRMMVVPQILDAPNAPNDVPGDAFVG
ncbi:hypothetical protein As57867_007082, partial [Aphanomyces stellatus]